MTRTLVGEVRVPLPTRDKWVTLFRRSSPEQLRTRVGPLMFVDGNSLQYKRLGIIIKSPFPLVVTVLITEQVQR